MQLIDYEKYILDNGLARPDKVRYFSGWVKKFLAMGLSEQLSSDDKIKQFRRFLDVDTYLEDWQRKQGQQAIEIYLNMYLEVITAIEAPGAVADFGEYENKARTVFRLKHYAYRTEKTYLDWIKKYFRYCSASSYDFKDSNSVKLYLSYLATKREVAASTQNQAFNSLLFLFRYVFEVDLDGLKGTVRARARKNLPVVLSVDEVKSLFEQVSGTKQLILELVYGTGLRVSELARLRVMNLDFGNGMLIVKDGKGGKDRAVRLPKKLIDPLHEHLEKGRMLHDSDLKLGHGEVYLPQALARKYPAAGKEWKWQYVFPSGNLAVDPRSGKVRRHHVLVATVQRIMRAAVQDAGIVKKATVHSLRHSFATHLLMSGVNIREIQELLGHRNVETTMIYTHVVKDLSTTPDSPLDML